MTTALSLYLPRWPIDLLERRGRPRAGPADARGSAPPDAAGAPTAAATLLVSTAGQRRTVACCCPRAAAAGVRPGMDLAHARALLPPAGVREAPFTPARDGAALRRLALWAVRFAPLVAADPPDGLLLDAGGCERLYGSVRAIVDRVADAAARMGLHARVAAAPTFACAWAAARFLRADRAVVPEGEQAAALAHLPVAALRVDAEAVSALAEVGVTRIGQFMDLPRAEIPARFGHALLLRLDQALGRAPEALDPVRPREPLRVERVFAGPSTSLEAVNMATRPLISALCGLLAQRGLGALRVDLVLDRAGAEPLVLTVRLSRPGRGAPHLWALLRPRIETANMGFGVERIALSAPVAAPLRGEQAECWASGGGARDPREIGPALGELIDAVAGRCGPRSVLRLEPVASHIPERSWRAVPVMEHPPTAPAPPARAAGGAAGLDDAIVAADRPSVLLDPPEPVQAIALAPDGAPSWLRWRGREHAIVARASGGAERIAPEWWRDGGGTLRDYFRVRDRAGLWLWVYHEPRTGRWFVHGLWA